MPANLTTKLGQLVDVLTPDTTNTRIGVANASPTRTLDVTGTFGASGASTLGGTLTAAAANFSGAITAAGTGATLAATISMNANTTGEPAYFAAGGTDTNVGIDLNTKGTGSLRLNVNSTVAVTVANGGKVGIGMTPSNILDITQTQDTASNISLRNSSTGTSASSRVYLGNSVSATSGRLITWGSGFTSTGVYRQDGLLLEGVGAGGVTISANAAQPIYFGINSIEIARFDISGQLMVGTTSNNGSISNTAPVIGGNIITNRGTVSVGNSATVTMFSTTSGLANYLVSAAINVGDASNYACAALVLTDGSSTQVVQLRNGANGTSITASGQAIRFTNGAIGTQTVYWSVTRMGHN